MKSLFRLTVAVLSALSTAQAGFTDKAKGRLYLELAAGGAGLWGTVSNPNFSSLQSRGNIVTELDIGYDYDVYKGFAVGVFGGGGYGNVHATKAFKNIAGLGRLTLRDHGFIDGGIRLSQRLSSKFVASVKIGIAGHNMYATLSGARGGQGSIAVTGPLTSGYNGIWYSQILSNATVLNGSLCEGNTFGVVTTNGTVVSALPQGPGGGGFYINSIATILPNGTVIGVVADGGAVNVNVAGGENGYLNGLQTAAFTNGTTIGYLQVPPTQTLTRMVSFLLIGLEGDYFLSNRLSVGLSFDISLGSKKTYSFTGPFYADGSAPATSIKPTYGRVMLTAKYVLN